MLAGKQTNDRCLCLNGPCVRQKAELSINTIVVKVWDHCLLTKLPASWTKKKNRITTVHKEGYTFFFFFITLWWENHRLLFTLCCSYTAGCVPPVTCKTVVPPVCLGFCVHFEVKVLVVSASYESNPTAEALTHFKHSLFLSCGPLRVVRTSIKAEMLTPLVFSPASNRV